MNFGGCMIELLQNSNMIYEDVVIIIKFLRLKVLCQKRLNRFYINFK